MRFSIDYRRLNEATIKDAYSLPRISACLDALGGAKYLSIFYIRSGYFQVDMDPADACETAFLTREDYERTKMPFRLCNAPGTFQRLADLTPSDLNFQIRFVYLDDFIVYSLTFSEHLQRLDQHFQR